MPREKPAIGVITKSGWRKADQYLDLLSCKRNFCLRQRFGGGRRNNKACRNTCPDDRRKPHKILLRCARHPHPIKMRNDFLRMHHIGIFVMQVEKVHLVRQFRAIIGALFGDRDVEPGGMRIDRTRPYTSRRTLAADDDARHIEEREMRGERRALEYRGTLLGDENVCRLDLELMKDRVGIGLGSCTLVLGRDGPARTVVRPRFLRAEKYRDAGPSCRCDEPLGRLDRAMSEDPACIGILIIDLDRRTWPAAIRKIIKINRQQRRSCAHEGFTPPSRIEPQVSLRDHVLPTMVVELLHGGHVMLL